MKTLTLKYYLAEISLLVEWKISYKFEVSSFKCVLETEEIICGPLEISFKDKSDPVINLFN